MGVTRSQGRIKPIHIVLTAVVSGICGLLDVVGIVAAPIGVIGVSGFYVAAAFYVPFALWFGIWGALAGWFGPMLGSLLTGRFTIHSPLSTLCDLWEALLPLAAFKLLKADIELKSKKDWMVWIIFGVLGASIVSAAWGPAYIVFVQKSAPAAIYPVIFWGWLIGDIIVLAVIGTLLMKTLSKFIKRTPVYIEGWY